MRSRRLNRSGYLILIWAVLSGSHALGEPAKHTISKSEVRSASPSVTHDRLKEVVWDLFKQQDYRTKKTPTRRLSHLFLDTKTQGTHVHGLCRYDSVDVQFEPVRPNEKGPGVPTKAVGIRSTSHFLFRAPPAREYEDLAQPTLVSAAQCAHVSKEQPFFTAASEQEATEAYRIWLRLLDAATRESKLKLVCNFGSAEKALPCAQVVASLKPDELSEVEACDAPSYELRCHKLYAGDHLITVETRGYIYPGPPPGEIVSAQVDTLIVTGDLTVD